jgi:hypothetical protein
MDFMKRVTRMLILGVILAGLSGFVIGCGSDDDDDIKTISVCNLDNEEYQVRLHRMSDNVVVGEFHLEEVYEFRSVCKEFKDYPEGRYYITIYEDNQTEPADTSADFYLDAYDYHTFTIDSTGSINR